MSGYAKYAKSILAILIVLLLTYGCAGDLSDVGELTVDHCAAFLIDSGLDILSEPCEIVYTVIPESFDAVWESFNGIQIDQGFDLYDYRGCNVIRQTYAVINFDGVDSRGTVYADVFIFGDTIIGADIRSVRADGFMRGVIQKKNGTDKSG